MDEDEKVLILILYSYITQVINDYFNALIHRNITYQSLIQ